MFLWYGCKAPFPPRVCKIFATPDNTPKSRHRVIYPTNRFGPYVIYTHVYTDAHPPLRPFPAPIVSLSLTAGALSIKYVHRHARECYRDFIPRPGGRDHRRRIIYNTFTRAYTSERAPAYTRFSGHGAYTCDYAYAQTRARAHDGRRQGSLCGKRRKKSHLLARRVVGTQ